MTRPLVTEWEEPVPQPEPPKLKHRILVRVYRPEGYFVYTDPTISDLARALGVDPKDLEEFREAGNLDIAAAKRGWSRLTGHGQAYGIGTQIPHLPGVGLR